MPSNSDEHEIMGQREQCPAKKRPTTLLNFENFFEEDQEYEYQSGTMSNEGMMGKPINASKLLFERDNSAFTRRSRSPSPRSDAGKSCSSSRSGSPTGRRLSAMGIHESPISAVNPVGRNGMRNCIITAVALIAFTAAASQTRPKLSRTIEVECSSMLRRNNLDQMPSRILERSLPAHSTFSWSLWWQGQGDCSSEIGNDSEDVEPCEANPMRLRGGDFTRRNSSPELQNGQALCEECTKANLGEPRQGFESSRDASVNAVEDKTYRPKLSRTVDIH